MISTYIYHIHVYIYIYIHIYIYTYIAVFVLTTREFNDVVFEDVAFDNNSFVPIYSGNLYYCVW